MTKTSFRTCVLIVPPGQHRSGPIELGTVIQQIKDDGAVEEVTGIRDVAGQPLRRRQVVPETAEFGQN